MAQYFFTTRYRVGMGISFSCQLSEKEVMRYNDYMVGSATYKLVRLSRYYFSHGILQGCRGGAVKVASFAKANNVVSVLFPSFLLMQQHSVHYLYTSYLANV